MMRLLECTDSEECISRIEGPRGSSKSSYFPSIYSGEENASHCCAFVTCRNQGSIEVTELMSSKDYELQRITMKEEDIAAAAAAISPSGNPLLLVKSQPLSSTSRTFANLVLCIVGTGVLGLPYSFSTIGWAMGIIIVILSGAVAYHGMMLQIRSKRLLHRYHGDELLIASYGDLMFYAFGRYGRMAVDVLLSLSTLAAGISYITFVSQSVASIASSIEATHKSSDLGLSWMSSSTYTWFIFPLEVALAAIPSVTLLAPFSAVGDTVNFTALAALMGSDIMEIKATLGFQYIKPIVNLMSVPSAFGVGVYAFQSAGIMIPLEASMEEPLKLGSVMGAAFVLSGAVYAVFAVLGYAAYGENIQQVITLNLPSGIEATLVKAAVSFSLFLAFPLMLNPMSELVERRFARRKVSLGLRTSIVFIICLMATTIKQFVDLLSLAGSSISCLLGFILPAAVHIKVMKEDVERQYSTLIYAADYLLIMFGLIFGAFGTTMSFLKFV
ncbi:hypothetical protein L7F22_044781 [Adiantum nelumboides]|nr:hypothetical protein [Adiantum nelumboides]